MEKEIDVSVVTPSFNMLSYLERCVASVADQEGVQAEHLVMDGGSRDGTVEWLKRQPSLVSEVRDDSGMYDAVNRGFRRSRGQIVAHLNCDEQYLPGALMKVLDFFQRHPRIEVLFADAIVVNDKGEYLCHREALLPLKYHTWVGENLAILTCATFFRRSVLDRDQLFFDATVRDVGDARWIMDLIDRNVSMALLKQVTSVFTETGANMNLLPNARKEIQELASSAPAWVRKGRPLFLVQHRVRRLLAGHYRPKALTYSLFTERSPHERVTMQVSNPTFRWIRPIPQMNAIDNA